MKRRTTRAASAAPSAGNWLTTYSDLVTLLLCFFVLLYSFSVLDVEKFRKFVASFQGQGIMDGVTSPINRDPSPVPVQEGPTQDLDGPFWSDSGKMLVHIQDFLNDNGIEGQVRAYREQGGVLVEIQDHLLFDSAKANIRPDGLGLLNTLSVLFAQMPNSIVVEGHTDNIPINTAEFPSNWELSTARATRVVRYYVDVRGLDPRRMAAMGFSEFHPISSNATAEGRSENRRVVFFIREF
jgi:chemotaxis protein MotB